LTSKTVSYPQQWTEVVKEVVSNLPVNRWGSFWRVDLTVRVTVYKCNRRASLKLLFSWSSTML